MSKKAQVPCCMSLNWSTNGGTLCSRYIDGLVRVWANTYVAEENPADQWVHGMSKKARAESKRKTILNLKKAKEARVRLFVKHTVSLSLQLIIVFDSSQHLYDPMHLCGRELNQAFVPRNQSMKWLHPQSSFALCAG